MAAEQLHEADASPCHGLCLADDACASGLASKARAKPVTAYAERYTHNEQLAHWKRDS